MLASAANTERPAAKRPSTLALGQFPAQILERPVEHLVYERRRFAVLLLLRRGGPRLAVDHVPLAACQQELIPLLIGQLHDEAGVGRYAPLVGLLAVREAVDVLAARAEVALRGQLQGRLVVHRIN